MTECHHRIGSRYYRSEGEKRSVGKKRIHIYFNQQCQTSHTGLGRVAGCKSVSLRLSVCSITATHILCP